MKFLRFGSPGEEKPAIIDKEGAIRDLSDVISDISADTVGRLPKLSDGQVMKLPMVDRGQRIGPCLSGVGKFICVGLNYSDHARELGMQPPSEPVIFLKACSAISGPHDSIVIPRNANKVDWEAELGVVIGKKAKYVSQDQASSLIAGYFCVNDVSERNFQNAPGGQWAKGKSCDGFGPIGPWLVTPDEVPNNRNLAIRLSVNDQIFQSGSTATMIFSVEQLISHVSHYFTLYPGDIISTGTPPGVGMGQKPPVFLKSGDRVKLSIEGLGEQNALVVDE